MTLIYINRDMSLPSRERGLKYGSLDTWRAYAGSLPSRERGLKYGSCSRGRSYARVAPFTGAWIEIDLPYGKPVLY